MSNPKKSKQLGDRSILAALSNLGLAAASPAHAGSISQEATNETGAHRSTSRSDVALDLSIASLNTLKETAEAIPVAGGPLAITCGIMIPILELVKECKENREGWEQLAVVIREKNESVIALLKLYSKAPTEYPNAERQASEYQRLLNDIAEDIKKETQRSSEVPETLDRYWSRMKSVGREAVLANINAEKIASYQEQLRGIALDVIEMTVIHQALTTAETNMVVAETNVVVTETNMVVTETNAVVMEMNMVMNEMRADLKAVLAEKSASTGPSAILKPRPREVSDFVGRTDILDSMCEIHFGHEGSLSSSGGPIITVLAGMGGSGKTQIAAKFASLFEERFPKVPIFFLDASSEVSLKTDLTTLLRSQTDKYDDALTWLASGIDDWLLIMDNADDPSLKLSDFFPRCRHGHIIITTRNTTHRLLAPRSTHVVDVLPTEDSISLLLSASCNEDNETNRSLARDIVEELGGLPLALAHAAAYILINNCIDTFLATYRQSRNEFLRSAPSLPQGYPYSVERTIEMSFRCLSPRTQEMIQLLSYLDARSIARCIIEKAAERKFLHIPRRVESTPQPDTIAQAKFLQGIFCSSGEWRPFEFDGMIGECLKYSLLQFSTVDGEKFYFMHPLVQKYLQATSSTMQDHSTGRLIVRLLASAITRSDRWYELIGFDRLLGPHIRLIRLEDVTEAGDHCGLGKVLCELGDELSIAHLERSVEMLKASEGKSDEELLDSMGVLVSSYYLLGRAQKALSLAEEVLERQKQIHGPDHLHTLVAMSNLASSYQSAGRPGDALPLREEVLEKRKRKLGPDHLSTLGAMSNLASSYRLVGRVQDALLLEEEVLQKQKQVLGPDNLETLTAMANLASSYWSVGRAADALPLREEVLEKQKRILGPDHHLTLTAMGNLASSYRLAGRVQESLALNEEVLKKRKQVLGPDHQHTLTAMGNLASSYRSVGRVQDALPLEEEVLEKRKQVLGPDHLEVLTSMSNLASSYSSIGRTRDALLLQEELVERRKRVLGLDHKDTLTAMGNLASSYRLAGRVQDSLLLQEEVLEKRKQVLGSDHPYTLTAMGNVANCYRLVGRTQEALPLQKEVFETRKKLLGPDHRDTLLAMYNLLLTLKALAMKEELISLAEVALPLYEKIHGSDHEHTVRIRGLLSA